MDQDLHHRFGRRHHAVGYEGLIKRMDENGVEMEKGDMARLYTGFATV